MILDGSHIRSRNIIETFLEAKLEGKFLQSSNLLHQLRCGQTSKLYNISTQIHQVSTSNIHDDC